MFDTLRVRMLLLGLYLLFVSVGVHISVGVVLASDHTLILLTMPHPYIVRNVSTALCASKCDMKSNKAPTQPSLRGSKEAADCEQTCKGWGFFGSCVGKLAPIITMKLGCIPCFNSPFRWMTGSGHPIRTCNSKRPRLTNSDRAWSC